MGATPSVLGAYVAAAERPPPRRATDRAPSASALLGAVAGLLLEAAFVGVADTYCLANFHRCREARCIVTDPHYKEVMVAAAGFEPATPRL